MRKSAIVATIVAASMLPAGAAHAQSSTSPVRKIGPNQFFNGLVNDRASESTIVLACPPIRPATTGHPLAGQSVSVHELFPPVIAPGLGFTGGASTIAASLRIISPSATVAASPLPLAVFSLYDAKVAIPTTLNLPCGGAGAVVFQPVQGGNAAQNDTREGEVRLDHRDELS